MFLTPEELKTLTGYELAAWQRRWLDSHGWIYERARNGRVSVSRAYAESRLSGTVVKREPAMNIDWMKKRA
jgi:hypothetical protein